MEEKRPQISIELSPEQAEGIYSNFVLITHSPSEFILDFARMVPGVQKTKVYARVIMNPQNILLLKSALDENLKKYEERFGKIRIFGKEDKEIGFK